MYKFFPHTETDLKEMLRTVGVDSIDALYDDIPEHLRFRGDYELPEAMSELEVRQLFQQLGSQNRQLTCFAGAGVYDQSMMTALTGMDISNASMYDGTTATAEAMMMAVAAGKKQNRVLVSETMDEKTLAVVREYAHFQGIDVQMIPAKDGVTDYHSLLTILQSSPDGIAGVLVQQPNRYGIVENYDGFADACHNQKALFIMNSVVFDLALLKTPGEWGADIAVGDGQSLGIPMQWGGPYVGYMCCTEKLIRKMPGRIVGKTIDSKGQRAFVLTLQAREQHIRRQKATSNICSNQSLMALFVTIYCSLMGKQGLHEAAQLSYDGAEPQHRRDRTPPFLRYSGLSE